MLEKHCSKVRFFFLVPTDHQPSSWSTRGFPMSSSYRAYGFSRLGSGNTQTHQLPIASPPAPSALVMEELWWETSTNIFSPHPRGRFSGKFQKVGFQQEHCSTGMFLPSSNPQLCLPARPGTQLHLEGTVSVLGVGVVPHMFYSYILCSLCHLLLVDLQCNTLLNDSLQFMLLIQISGFSRLGLDWINTLTQISGWRLFCFLYLSVPAFWTPSPCSGFFFLP